MELESMRSENAFLQQRIEEVLKESKELKEENRLLRIENKTCTILEEVKGLRHDFEEKDSLKAKLHAQRFINDQLVQMLRQQVAEDLDWLREVFDRSEPEPEIPMIRIETIKPVAPTATPDLIPQHLWDTQGKTT